MVRYAWYSARLPEIREVLAGVADTLRAGVDGDLVPWTDTVPTANGSVRVAVSAQRRIDGATVAQGIRSALDRDVNPLAATKEAECASE